MSNNKIMAIFHFRIDWRRLKSALFSLAVSQIRVPLFKNHQFHLIKLCVFWANRKSNWSSILSRWEDCSCLFVNHHNCSHVQILEYVATHSMYSSDSFVVCFSFLFLSLYLASLFPLSSHHQRHPVVVSLLMTILSSMFKRLHSQ